MVLELDYLVEEISAGAVTYVQNPGNDSGSYVSRNTHIFNPSSTGIYQLEINNQIIEIDVYDIPDSGVVDDFESQSLDNYYYDTGSFGFTSSSKEGGYALICDSYNVSTLKSDYGDGLEYYPQRGQTHSF